MGAETYTAKGAAKGMLDGIKWFVSLVLLGGALGAFYYYVDQSLLLRVVGLLAAAGISVAIMVQTEKGRAAWGVVQEARTEVRKVVWPTRKETVQTTMVVIAIVVVVAVILWMFDGLLAYLMRHFFGHGG